MLNDPEVLAVTVHVTYIRIQEELGAVVQKFTIVKKKKKLTLPVVEDAARQQHVRDNYMEPIDLTMIILGKPPQRIHW